MAEVHAVAIFRVKPGRYSDLFEALRPAKKALERSGATVTVVRQEIGPETGSVVVVSRYPDWNAWVKARADQEFTRARDAMRSSPNPPFDSITTALFEEVALLIAVCGSRTALVLSQPRRRYGVGRLNHSQSDLRLTSSEKSPSFGLG